VYASRIPEPFGSWYKGPSNGAGAFVRDMALIFFFAIALIRIDVAEAQNDELSTPRASTGERPEEIVVRGKRLADFRVEVEKARVRAYDVFNEINSTDDFDVSCNVEQRTGTRLGRQVCVARFEGRVSRRAAQDYMAAIRDRCQGQLSADCMFDPNIAGAGTLAAKGVEGELPRQRALMSEEIYRLARTDLRFGQAILDFYEASQRYEEERNGSRERKREP
jgi:hypothetical protein